MHSFAQSDTVLVERCAVGHVAGLAAQSAVVAPYLVTLVTVVDGCELVPQPVTSARRVAELAAMLVRAPAA